MKRLHTTITIRKALWLLFFTTCSASISLAQNSGVILHTGDTVLGTYSLNKGSFVVKKARDAKEIVLNAGQVRSVFNDKENSTVLSLKLETYSDNPEMVMDVLEFDRVTDTVMLLKEVYSTPKMNLYWAKDVKLVQYYFIKTPEDSIPQQLLVRYKLYNAGAGERGANGYANVEAQRIYIDQLKSKMGSCQSISEEEWEQIEYRIYSLKKIIKRFNQCN